MVTSSAVVGSSAISRSGLHASAMAIMTRWRIPPDNWKGYCRTLFRRGNADQFQHLNGFVHRLFLAQILMDLVGLRDLITDGEDRVERCHRLLEDHRDLIALFCASAARIVRADSHRYIEFGLRRFVPDVRSAAGWTGTKCFSRTGFAHDPERPPFAYG